MKNKMSEFFLELFMKNIKIYNLEEKFKKYFIELFNKRKNCFRMETIL